MYLLIAGENVKNADDSGGVELNPACGTWPPAATVVLTSAGATRRWAFQGVIDALHPSRFSTFYARQLTEIGNHHIKQSHCETSQPYGHDNDAIRHHNYTKAIRLRQAIAATY
jgi:hypothetical protein